MNLRHNSIVEKTLYKHYMRRVCIRTRTVFCFLPTPGRPECFRKDGMGVVREAGGGGGVVEKQPSPLWQVLSSISGSAVVFLCAINLLINSYPSLSLNLVMILVKQYNNYINCMDSIVLRTFVPQSIRERSEHQTRPTQMLPSGAKTDVKPALAMPFKI